MAKKKDGAPRLDLSITEDQWRTARDSDSGGCLIADAIKRQYPHLSAVRVDMATVRVTDRAKGLRYTWLTPGPAQMLLLSFDQGWPHPTEKVTLTGAVKITKVKVSSRAAQERRRERRRALEAAAAAGEPMTREDKVALTRMRNEDARTQGGSRNRPTSEGPVEDVLNESAGGAATVIGGRPLVQGPPHPNLLRGRDRHYGAKVSQPSVAFQTAVDQAVAEHLAQNGLELPRNQVSP